MVSVERRKPLPQALAPKAEGFRYRLPRRKRGGEVDVAPDASSLSLTKSSRVSGMWTTSMSSLWIVGAWRALPERSQTPAVVSCGCTSSSPPDFTSKTKPRISPLWGTKGLPLIRAIDCWTSSNGSSKASRANEGLISVSS